MKTFKQFLKESLEDYSQNLAYLDSDASEETKRLAVSKNGYSIIHIKNPSVDLQKLAIKVSPYVIAYINNVEAQISALKNDESLFQHITNPSKEIQEWFINQDPSNILKISKDKLDSELAEKYKYLLSMDKAGVLK